jgi:signal transduction histidine kinase
MQSSNLFNHTRRHLTFWYAGVMGTIILAFGALAHTLLTQLAERSVDQDLAMLSGTFRDSLEGRFKEPGIISKPEAEQFLPGFCLPDCNENHLRQRFSSLQGGDYYVRLLDLSGRTLGALGDRGDLLPPVLPDQTADTVKGPNGKPYHVHTQRLKAQNQKPWGYLQVARSADKLDKYMTTLHILLLLGIPLAMLSLGGASWWLSGLAMRPIYQSYDQIQQFTADAAHELRTPLAATRATVESAMLLGSELSRDEVQQTLTIVDRQVIRLAQLAQDLLLLSRMDGTDPKHWQPCCLNDMLRDLEEELAHLAMKNDVQLTIEVPAVRLFKTLGNEEQLYRLFTNLITNAIHYAPGGNVEIILGKEAQTAVIWVKDNGSGIDLEQQAKIFDRFYRVDCDRSRLSGGTGLGLAIAKAIIVAHRGRIQVQSEVGQGSTFIVVLPLV